MKRIDYIIVFLLCNCVVLAQNFSPYGKIETHYFGEEEHHSQNQIWTGVQDKDYNLIFGNSVAVLCFNGSEWTDIPLDTSTIFKKDKELISQSLGSCLFRSSNDETYVGRSNSFGKIGYNKKGMMVYQPFFAEKNELKLGTVWNIIEFSDGTIYFLGNNKTYSYNKGKIRLVNFGDQYANYEVKNSFKLGDGYLIEFKHRTIDFGSRRRKFLYIDYLTKSKKEITAPKSGEMDAENGNGTFVKNGKHFFMSNFEGASTICEYSPSKSTFSIVPISLFPGLIGVRPSHIKQYEEYTLVSTLNDGVIVLDKNLSYVWKFNIDNEMVTNLVNTSFLDKNKNLWCCTGNGIQFYETKSPINYFGKSNGLQFIIESIDFLNGRPLLGTQTGIYTYNYQKDKSAGLIANHTELVFDLKSFKTNFGVKTICISDYGLYEIIPSTNSKKQINDDYAFRLCQDSNEPNRIFYSVSYQETQQIVSITLDKKGNWKREVVYNANDKVYSLCSLNGKIYFGIQNIGIGEYNCKTKKTSVIKIPEKEINAQNSRFYVEKFQGKLYVGTGNGIFVFNPKLKKCTRFAKDVFGSFPNYEDGIHRIVNIDNQQMWVVVTRSNINSQTKKLEKITGWFAYENGKLRWNSVPVGALKKGPLVYSISKNPSTGDIWFGTLDGLQILKKDLLKRPIVQFKVYLSHIDQNGRAKHYNPEKINFEIEFPYKNNSLSVYFRSSSYSSFGNSEYRYKLSGYDENWSEWSDFNFANFEKLPEGTYYLKVQAKSFYGEESNILNYTIKILPPWYRSIWAYFLYILIISGLVYATIQLSIHRVKLQKKKLEELVVERTSEIAEQNKVLEIQKEEITQKTTDILDSIHYAKRIQDTILPTDERLNQLFSEHLVFYRPKDIVSGDFYWARKIQDKILFSAIDCTGHGVPGALVSFVANNGLLRCVNELKLLEPNEILDNLRNIVIKAFQADRNNDVKDGMDMALCSLDPLTGVLKYSGAFNECIIIRDREIIELKATKQPIGLYDVVKPFALEVVQLEIGDCVYMTTDGYLDQFGGEKEKKFKAKPFKEMLLNFSSKPLNEQYKILEKTFDDWKGDIDQVDDVCVFAMRYNGPKS